LGKFRRRTKNTLENHTFPPSVSVKLDILRKDHDLLVASCWWPSRVVYLLGYQSGSKCPVAKFPSQPNDTSPRSQLCIALRWQARKLRLSHRVGLHSAAFSQLLLRTFLSVRRMSSVLENPELPNGPGQNVPKSGAIRGTENRRGFAVPAERWYRGEWSRTTAASPESASTGLVLRLCGCYSSAVHAKMRSTEMIIARLSHGWHRR